MLVGDYWVCWDWCLWVFVLSVCVVFFWRVFVFVWWIWCFCLLIVLELGCRFGRWSWFCEVLVLCVLFCLLCWCVCCWLWFCCCLVDWVCWWCWVGLFCCFWRVWRGRWIYCFWWWDWCCEVWWFWDFFGGRFCLSCGIWWWVWWGFF